LNWTTEFATCVCFFEALQFTPRLKDVLLRVLPILGSVRDGQRPVFANGIAMEFPEVISDSSNVSENYKTFRKLAFSSIITIFSLPFCSIQVLVPGCMAVPRRCPLRASF
jgi:hypothetical protein